MALGAGGGAGLASDQRWAWWEVRVRLQWQWAGLEAAAGRRHRREAGSCLDLPARYAPPIPVPGMQ